MEDILYEELKSLLNSDFKYKKIQAGFSTDIKYKLICTNNMYLLRMSNLDMYENRFAEFQIMESLSKIGVKCNKPVHFNKFEEVSPKICYSLFHFIDGVDAESALGKHSNKVQYNIGLEAGRDLKKINSLKSSTNTWKERKIKKNAYYITEYNKLNYSFPKDKNVELFINENINCIDNSQNYLQHDDFHPGNIIINNKKYVGVIDFNRIDWGDPIHEFVKLGWFGKSISINFARGQMDGYFSEEIIDSSFWLKYSVYLAMSIYSTIVWHFKYFHHLINDIEKLILEILQDHNYFKNEKPAWLK